MEAILKAWAHSEKTQNSIFGLVLDLASLFLGDKNRSLILGGTRAASNVEVIILYSDTGDSWRSLATTE